MKLHTSLRAPNPRRVDMFLHRERHHRHRARRCYDLNAGEHRSAKFTAMNPIARVPVLELDDGRFLAESRAICSYLESLYPEPNLMGVDAEERAFIEMADRQVELTLLAAVANHVRHTHPGLLPLENPQFADYAAEQGKRMVAAAALFDRTAVEAALDGGRPVHDRGHHRVLWPRVRTAREIPSSRCGPEAPGRLAGARGGASERQALTELQGQVSAGRPMPKCDGPRVIPRAGSDCVAVL